MTLVDGYGRQVSYLRLSITDRCNYHCRYCLPESGVHLLSHGDLLSFEEIERVTRCFVRLGIRRVRMTGGEPLLRRGFDGLLQRLSSISGIEALALTTNGFHLAEHADTLKRLGVAPINVSLDTLDAERFRWVTRGGSISHVLGGIETARAAGLQLKTNTVVIRQFNDMEVTDIVDFAIDHQITARFIELMPTGPSDFWTSARFVPLAEVRASLEPIYRIEPLDGSSSGGPVRLYSVTDRKRPWRQGRVGLIEPLSRPFCSSCNRMRLTSTGGLRLCLAREEEVSLRDLMRSGADDSVLRETISSAVKRRRWRHTFRVTHNGHRIPMASIGG